jgi:hypothetical protein
MIQRIQTLFLGLVVIVMSLNLFSPVWQASNNEKQIVVMPFYLLEKTGQQEQHHGVLYIALAIIAILGIAIFSMAKFKNRALQIRLGMLNSVLLCAVVLAFYIVIGKGKAMMGTSYDERFEVGFYLPLIAIVFNILANRFIKKDDDLVKSVDRIR